MTNLLYTTSAFILNLITTTMEVPLTNKFLSLSASARRQILSCSVLFGLYAFYLLIEVLDFLALLHSKEPDYNATYTIVHVAYFIIEMVVCLGLALWIAVINPKRTDNYILPGIILAVIRLLRIIMVYYLYHYSEPTYHFVPYIYKLANPLSNFFRFTFIYLQIIMALIASITCFRAYSASRKLQFEKSRMDT